MIKDLVEQYGKIYADIERRRVWTSLPPYDSMRNRLKSEIKDLENQSKVLLLEISEKIKGNRVPEGMCQLASDEENGLLSWTPREGTCSCCGGEWIQGQHIDKEEVERWEDINEFEQKMMDEYADETYRNCPACQTPRKFEIDVVDKIVILTAICENCGLSEVKDSYGSIENMTDDQKWRLFRSTRVCSNCGSTNCENCRAAGERPIYRCLNCGKMITK
jgi:hypothetical protein